MALLLLNKKINWKALPNKVCMEIQVIFHFFIAELTLQFSTLRASAGKLNTQLPIVMTFGKQYFLVLWQHWATTLNISRKNVNVV